MWKNRSIWFAVAFQISVACQALHAGEDVCDPLDGRGSLLIYPNVELKWDDAGALVQNTVLSLRNRSVFDVSVLLYFVNGDPPAAAVFSNGVLVERAHPGWNHFDCQVRLGRLERKTYSAATGQSLGCQPFVLLDPGSPPGRPDPDGPPAFRTLRGYVLAWAVNQEGREISWNDLTGDAEVRNLTTGLSWEYDAFAFRAISASRGQESDCVPGRLLLDGVEYARPYASLELSFTASGVERLSSTNQMGVVDTDLTLVPVSVDLRQDSSGPRSTKARFAVRNARGTGLSGTERCVTCWDQTLLSQYDAPNHFLRGNLQTDTGSARIDSIASARCPGSETTALLGAFHELLTSAGATLPGDLESFGGRLMGSGSRSAVIQYDPIRFHRNPEGEGTDRGSERIDFVPVGGTARIVTDGPLEPVGAPWDEAASEPSDDAHELSEMASPKAAEGGAARAPLSSGALTLIDSIPPNGAIDARQPVDPVSGAPTGWDTLYLTFDADARFLVAADFHVDVFPSIPAGVVPAVRQVVPHCENVSLILDRPIPPGARTVITYLPTGQSVCLGYLPGDVNSDRLSAPLDILRLVDNLNGILPAPLEIWQCDLDRSCQCSSADIVTLVNLLNGAGAFNRWFEVGIPECP